MFLSLTAKLSELAFIPLIISALVNSAVPTVLSVATPFLVLAALNTTIVPVRERAGPNVVPNLTSVIEGRLGVVSAE